MKNLINFVYTKVRKMAETLLSDMKLDLCELRLYIRP